MDVRAPLPALAGCAAAALAVALVPRPIAGAVLAATAGTLFEAAPFIVLASLLPSRLRGVADLAGCGCGGRGRPPGALAPVAFAVCWLSFGPAIALARAAAAGLPIVIRRARSRRPASPRHDRHGRTRADEHTGETFSTFSSLAASSAATALVAPHLGSLATQPVFAALAGLGLGAILPCATAGVAIAAGCAGRDPWLAAGVLATAGVVPRIGPSKPHPQRIALRTNHGERFALFLLAVALGTLVLRGGAGLVNPKLLIFAGLAAAVAAGRALGKAPAISTATDPGRSGPRSCIRSVPAPAVPAIMLAALIAGSPEPPYAADETTALAAFPGEPVTFAGSAHADGAATRIVRFSITCCRLDATALAVTVDRRLDVRDGSWVRVRGRFVLRDGRLVVHPDRAAPIAAPSDPFVYR